MADTLLRHQQLDLATTVTNVAPTASKPVTSGAVYAALSSMVMPEHYRGLLDYAANLSATITGYGSATSGQKALCLSENKIYEYTTGWDAGTDLDPEPGAGDYYIVDLLLDVATPAASEGDSGEVIYNGASWDVHVDKVNKIDGTTIGRNADGELQVIGIGKKRFDLTAQITAGESSGTYNTTVFDIGKTTLGITAELVATDLIVVQYAGQVLTPGVSYTLDFSLHQLTTTTTDPLDDLENRKLELIVVRLPELA